jgi:hypothetical protein
VHVSLFGQNFSKGFLTQPISSIISAFKVQKRLDLEDIRTAFNYLQRFAEDIIKREAN